MLERDGHRIDPALALLIHKPVLKVGFQDLWGDQDDTPVDPAPAHPIHPEIPLPSCQVQGDHPSHRKMA